MAVAALSAQGGRGAIRYVRVTGWAAARAARTCQAIDARPSCSLRRFIQYGRTDTIYQLARKRA